MQCVPTFCLNCAARCGSAHPASPLFLCQLCSVSQCARLGFAPHRCWGGTSPVLRKCWSVRYAQTDVTTLRRATGSATSSSAVMLRMLPNITAFLSRASVALVSGHGGYTLASKHEAVAWYSVHCGTRPLRPPASLLHKAPFCKVLASRSAKAPLGVAHRCAPSRVYKTGLMQSGLRWGRSHSRQRSPVSSCPTRRRLTRPFGCRGTLASVRRFAQCTGQWPAASLVVCAPARRGLAAAQHWPHAPACPSAPQGGALSPARCRLQEPQRQTRERRCNKTIYKAGYLFWYVFGYVEKQNAPKGACLFTYWRRRRDSNPRKV